LDVILSTRCENDLSLVDNGSLL